MSKRRFLSLMFIAGICATLLLLALRHSRVIPSTETVPGLTVSAAMSLKDALQEIQPLYQQQSNVKITYNFGASGSLQQQIEQGAPVDIFISAATKQMDQLQLKNLLLTGTRKNLLTNQLVLITPKQNQSINNLSDLTSNLIARIALGEPQSVPAGQYAEQTLKADKIYDQVNPKLIYAKDVRQVLTYVETGNVNAGFVYLTDARKSDKVKIVITASPQTHAPIMYPIAVIKNSKNVTIAKEFVEFLSSSQAESVFKKYGFNIAS